MYIVIIITCTMLRSSTHMHRKVFALTFHTYEPQSLYVHYVQASHSMITKSPCTLCSGLPQYDHKVCTYTMFRPPTGMHRKVFTCTTLGPPTGMHPKVTACTKPWLRQSRHYKYHLQEPPKRLNGCNTFAGDLVCAHFVFVAIENS